SKTRSAATPRPHDLAPRRPRSLTPEPITLHTQVDCTARPGSLGAGDALSASLSFDQAATVTVAGTVAATGDGHGHGNRHGLGNGYGHGYASRGAGNESRHP